MDPLTGDQAKRTESVPFLRSFKEDQTDDDHHECFHNLVSLRKKTKGLLKQVADFSGKAWEMGRSDPRKIVFAAKMGFALSVVSLLIFWRDSYYVDQYAIWGILTVIVMFEFTVGATLIKGFNRWLGTFFAGLLASFFALLSQLAGQWAEVVIVTSVFLVAFSASYLKLYPTMKAYEYGFRVFVLTYCILMVAGHKNGLYAEAVVTRLVLITLGAVVCLVVNICIFPIWSGEDLHNLVAGNFNGVASSLEGCVIGYLQCIEYERIPSKILTYQAAEDPLYKGYRSAVESKSQEEALIGFAVCEPPHGRYNMHNYPWKCYINLSGALRHCAFTVMALHGCILSEIQAPAERRQVLRKEMQRVGEEGAKVLRLLGAKLQSMERLDGPEKAVLGDVHDAAERLQKKIDQQHSYLLLSSSNSAVCHDQYDPQQPQLDGAFRSLSETVLDLGGFPTNMARTQSWPCGVDASENSTYESASALSLASFASLLIEFVARLQHVVASFKELSEKANFREPAEKPLDFAAS